MFTFFSSSRIRDSLTKNINTSRAQSLAIRSLDTVKFSVLNAIFSLDSYQKKSLRRSKKFFIRVFLLSVRFADCRCHCRWRSLEKFQIQELFLTFKVDKKFLRKKQNLNYDD